jgi:hypothetical protein
MLTFTAYERREMYFEGEGEKYGRKYWEGKQLTYNNEQQLKTVLDPIVGLLLISSHQDILHKFLV